MNESIEPAQEQAPQGSDEFDVRVHARMTDTEIELAASAIEAAPLFGSALQNSDLLYNARNAIRQLSSDLSSAHALVKSQDKENESLRIAAGSLLAKLSAGPKDVVVVQVPGRIEHYQAESIVKRFREILKTDDVNVLVLAGGTTLAAIDEESMRKAGWVRENQWIEGEMTV